MAKLDNTLTYYQQYSFQTPENYYSEITSTVDNIIHKYHLLIIEYIKFIIENLKINKLIYYKYIIVRGLETINHVFTIVLYHSKNIDMAYYHGQKAYFFFVEFITQITSDSNSFLHLSSKDAILFVYKKTIFDMNSSYCKHIHNQSEKDCEKLDYLELNMVIIKNIIQNSVQYNNIISLSIYIDTIFEYLLHIKLTSEDMFSINIFIEKIQQEDTTNMESYFELLYTFFKQYGTCDRKKLLIILKNKEDDFQIKKIDWIHQLFSK